MTKRLSDNIEYCEMKTVNCNKFQIVITAAKKPRRKCQILGWQKMTELETKKCNSCKGICRRLNTVVKFDIRKGSEKYKNDDDDVLKIDSK